MECFFTAYVHGLRYITNVIYLDCTIGIINTTSVRPPKTLEVPGIRFRPFGLISITTQLWSEYDKQTRGVKGKHHGDREPKKTHISLPYSLLRSGYPKVAFAFVLGLDASVVLLLLVGEDGVRIGTDILI